MIYVRSLYYSKYIIGKIIKIILLIFGLMIMPLTPVIWGPLFLHGYLLLRQESADKVLTDAVSATSFIATHQMKGTASYALFDVKNKKMLFVSADQHRLLDFSDVQSWVLEKKNKESIFTFSLNDIDNPIFKVVAASEESATEWHQRIKLLLELDGEIKITV